VARLGRPRLRARRAAERTTESRIQLYHRGGRQYSRDEGTPTWEALEVIVGGLESGKAVAFASGMAAIAAVFDQLVTGAVVALPDDRYQGVAGLAAAGERGDPLASSACGHRH
jgi:cystathionine beta-lyase/cystathionine gamma-synthase